MTDSANKDAPDWWENPLYDTPGDYARSVVYSGIHTALVAFKNGHIGIDDLPKVTDAVIRLHTSATSLVKKQERFIWDVARCGD